MTDTSLSAVAFRGLLWVTSSTALVTLGRLANLIILARLLSPEDFGVVAVALVAVTLMHFLVQLGLPAALVQKEELKKVDLDTALTISIASALAGLVALYLMAERLAVIIGSAKLADILPVLGFTLLLHAIFEPTEALLRREMKFRALARIDVGSYLLGYFLPSMGLAVLGMGVWALVAAYVLEKAVRCGQLLWLRGVVGGIGFSRESAVALLKFGGGFTLANFSNVAATRGDKAALARLGNASIVGEYDRAYQLMVLPANVMDSIVARVLFPTLARVKDKPESLRVNYGRGLALTATVIVPVAALCALMPGEIIGVLLGAQWSETAAVFRVLAIAMVFRCTYKLSDELSQACGAVYRRAWRQFVYAAAVIVGTLLGSSWGAIGAAVGVSLAIFLNFVLMADLTNRLTGFRWREVLAAHAPGIVLAGFAGVPAWIVSATGRAARWPDLAVLASGSGLAALAVVLAVAIRPSILGPAGAWVFELGRQAFTRAGKTER